MIMQLIGALGLFLLGMWMMTEGLKLAGGKALERLLSHWTSSKRRGLFAGIFITSLVQSSSAVTVATLGFVNAGLLTFQRALWVVFGSNVGTTFTAWIVTLFGFSFKVDAFALPLVGVGALLRLFYPRERGRSLGLALAGFGLLFLGIEALKTQFSGYSHSMNIQALLSDASFVTLWSVLIGIALTVLTQSSSAAIAIILTAVAGGIADVNVAAGAVIGANIGTTSTALIAGFGATANAKRLAWAHLIFNITTAMVALLVLPVFWWMVSGIAEVSHLDGNLLMTLAIFHTVFNVLGVLLMWPLESRLLSFLQNLYRSKEQSTGYSSHLDKNAASIPDVAVSAMRLEIQELLSAVSQFKLSRINAEHFIAKSHETVEIRIKFLNQFIQTAFQAGITKEQGKEFRLGLSASHHLNYSLAMFDEVVQIIQIIHQDKQNIPEVVLEWFKRVDQFVATMHDWTNENTLKQIEVLKQEYQHFKQSILHQTSEAELTVELLDHSMQLMSYARRYLEVYSHAREAFNQLCEPSTKPIESMNPSSKVETSS